MDAISLVNGAMARVLNEGYPRRPERPMTGVKQPPSKLDDDEATKSQLLRYLQGTVPEGASGALKAKLHVRNKSGLKTVTTTHHYRRTSAALNSRTTITSAEARQGLVQKHTNLDLLNIQSRDRDNNYENQSIKADEMLMFHSLHEVSIGGNAAGMSLEQILQGHGEEAKRPDIEFAMQSQLKLHKFTDLLK